MVSVLVANRGEIAVRIIRAVQQEGGRAVAIHPVDDAEALHVLLADEAVEIPGVGAAAYLDIAEVANAAVRTGCERVHPGYGFLSENAAFARRCIESGLTFIGPPPEQLDLFGDKARSRQYAIECGVPVLPGTSSAVSVAQAKAFVSEHGPVMLKALAGGGGRGMREVHDASTLADAFKQAASEAERAFGDADLYVEKLLMAPRHIEVQIAGDGTGAVVALGDRDCSIQRRHQKLIEVAPSPRLDKALRQRLHDAALRMGANTSYQGVGTVEFLVEGEEFWFIEVNPRIQVEHTVTEQVSGVDLVSLQLALAEGQTLEGLGLAEAPIGRGVAIEVRVNAETIDESGAPMPSVGTLQRFVLPSGPGVRVDTYGYAGYTMSPRYDSLLAKVVVEGVNMKQATARAVTALSEMTIEGVETNLDLLHGLVSLDSFAAGPWNTGFMTQNGSALREHRRNQRTELSSVKRETAIGTAASVPDGAVCIVAPSAGVVLSIEAQVGWELAGGAPVVVLEAMKMEHEIRTTESIHIEAVLVKVGDVVQQGDILAYGDLIEGLGTVATNSAESGPSSNDDERNSTDQSAAGSADWSAEVAEIERRRAMSTAMGGEVKLTRQRDAGKLDARERIAQLADAGSFREIGALSGFASGDQAQPDITPTNFIPGTARIEGRTVMLGVDDFTLRGGSGDAAIWEKQIFSERYACEMRLPVVRLLDGASGGGSVKMAMTDGYTYVPVNPGWDAVIEMLSLAPVVSAALGPTVGLGAARLVTSHLAIMVEDLGQVFTAGPPVVEHATGEKLTKEELGGAAIHRNSGVVERFVASEQEAFDVIRQFLSYLPSSVFELPPVLESSDPINRADDSLLSAVPRSDRRPYDMWAILEAVFDADSVFPYAEYGGGTLTALARLDGHPVGVISADPTLGATMSAVGAQAITRLVDLCETFHLPIVALTDQAGVSIGVAAEQAATVRHACRAISAVYQSDIPQAEVIIRRVFGVGGAGIVNRHRAVRSWAWPSGDWGSLPGRGGIEAAFRAQIAASADPSAEIDRLSAELEAIGSPFRTVENFGVQDIIDPRESRQLLCEWVADAYRTLPSRLGPPSFGTRP